ncbi:MAG: enoyl-CoA hydratase/isomerase family protein, partial [Pseudomonadota bacterium]
LPEVALGLIPDVGGTGLLARAPGRVGEYLGTTARRMGPGDAIWAGFADHFVPTDQWDQVKQNLAQTGDVSVLQGHNAPHAPLSDQQGDIDAHFGGEALPDILNSLHYAGDAFANATGDQLAQNCPLAMAAGVELIHRARGHKDIAAVLEQEYRFAHRAMEKGDFLEGIRAMVIDKDKSPQWRHSLTPPPMGHVPGMLQPLGPQKLNLTQP